MPMKVTVCFDKVKVLVPCGDGEILVCELIEKAIHRYRKAQGKPSDHWVSVHTLRTVSEDSILDPDDTLCDVVDDREQLVADFEEQGGPRHHHNGGDGQSVSSAGTASPEIFTSDLTNHKSDHQRGFSLDSNHDVIVTESDINSGSGLKVRRGSEPALNVLSDDEEEAGRSLKPSSKSQGDLALRQDETSPSQNEAHKPVIRGQREKEKTPPFSRFARDSWRQSLGNQPNMFKWLEAQERQEDRIKQTERQGPVGSATSPEHDTPVIALPAKKEVGILICLVNDGSPLGIHVVPHFNEAGRESGLSVQGIEDGGRINRDGRLKVHDRIIEINGHDLHEISFPKAQEIFRNAMKTDEVKLKVVKHSVPQMPKKLPPMVLPKPRGHSPTKPSPLTLPPQSYDLDFPDSSPAETSTPLEKNGDHNLHNQSSPVSSSSENSASTKTNFPVKALSPVGRRILPPTPPMRHPSTTLSTGECGSEGKNNKNSAETSDAAGKVQTGGQENKSDSGENSVNPTVTPSGTLTKNRNKKIAPTNTKKIGKCIEIELVKAQEGLGFSVTTRDNATGGPSPIYIKNILAKGAAVSDGRLKAGDRLLEVNGVEMTGKTQRDAVAMLRNTPLGSTVLIVVSRHELETDEEETTPQDERFRVPRPLHDSNTSDLEPNSNDLENIPQGHLDLHDTDGIFQPPDKAGDDGTLAVMKNKELIEFNIALNDTGSAGLGVSVKGKTLTTEEGTRDLGIFVKAVINGGAASKDGRLQVNDQLLEVNEVSLIKRTNTEAMDLLRNAMQIEGPVPGSINIKVARRIGAPSPSPFTSPGLEESNWGVPPGKELNNNDSFDNNDHVTKDGLGTPPRTANGDVMGNFKSPNMFLDRIIAGNGLRNESYTRATHDSYVDSPGLPGRKNIIDLTKQRPRPHSTLGIEHGSPSESSDEENKEPAWIKGPDWNRHPSQASDESELTPVGDGFSRDGFGRQSMSEKRKGHMDPRSSEIYQKVRGLKELNKGSMHQRGKSYDANIRGPKPPTNLKRFSSLENLSTMTPDQDQSTSLSYDDDEDEGVSPAPRMARRRGGNESFRAAVDRSYDPVPRLDMDTSGDLVARDTPGLQRSRSVEEEGSEGGSAGFDPTNSARSSVSDNVFGEDGKKKEGKNKETKKSGGFLKGLFKFGGGKARSKTPVDEVGKGKLQLGVHRPPAPHSTGLSAPVLSGPRTEVTGPRTEVTHREHMEYEEQRWREAQAQHDRAQEIYHQEQQQYDRDGRGMIAQLYHASPDPHSLGHSSPIHSDQPVNRAERIQQLRADHQRRHQERQGQYPQEEREEEYERIIQEQERQGARYTSDHEYFFYQKYGQSAIPSQLEGQGQRSRPSSRNQTERPNSRQGQGEQLPAGNYGNYQDPPLSGARHVSDSNVAKFSNVYRPASRGTSSSSMETNIHNPSYQHNYVKNSVVTPVQPFDRLPNHPLNNQRGTPVQDHERISNYRNIAGGQGQNNSNYQVVNRNTPTNFTPLERRSIANNYPYRQDLDPPPSSGSYGNSVYGYRDPVFTSMAGKRPVQTLQQQQQQPNSAKV